MIKATQISPRQEQIAYASPSEVEPARGPYTFRNFEIHAAQKTSNELFLWHGNVAP
jgi:hypothetical protein